MEIGTERLLIWETEVYIKPLGRKKKKKKAILRERKIVKMNRTLGTKNVQTLFTLILIIFAIYIVAVKFLNKYIKNA